MGHSGHPRRRAAEMAGRRKTTPCWAGLTSVVFTIGCRSEPFGAVCLVVVVGLDWGPVSTVVLASDPKNCARRLIRRSFVLCRRGHGKKTQGPVKQVRPTQRRRVGKRKQAMQQANEHRCGKGEEEGIRRMAGWCRRRKRPMVRGFRCRIKGPAGVGLDDRTSGC